MRRGYSNYCRLAIWAGLMSLAMSCSDPRKVSSPEDDLKRNKAYSAEEAVRRMKVADGFVVTPFATEQMITQPVAIEFDDRGRLWVIQYIQYPNPAGLNRVKVDRYSRTLYDQVPKPPPFGPKGADRITILEDSNGDGRADKAKDFITGLSLASGLAFGYGGVFVLQAPYLLFYPDQNQDDVPDSNPQVLLSGFGMEDAHSVANSLTWGPDGWLYGTQGSTVTAHIDGITFQQGVWRYHPLTRKFELFCEGGGNTWGLDFDAHGNLFASTNVGGYTMIHGVQGGYYWKNFGKHGPLQNPYTFGFFQHVPYENFHGRHVTVGGIVYQGDSFPNGFRGKYIAANLLSHAVYWHHVTPSGSSFSSSHAGELLEANDNWFAPSDLTMGPEGSVYVADWHDKRTAHPDPDAEWDRSNGRIYRISVQEMRNIGSSDLRASSSEELVSMLAHSNDWFVRRARRILAERRDRTVVASLRRMVLNHGNGSLALQALWALHGIEGVDDSLAAELLAHPSEDVRLWTIRLLGDAGKISESLSKQLTLLAHSDPSARVRSQLASTSKRLPGRHALPISHQLLLHEEDRKDPHIPLLLWWVVEDKAISNRETVLKLFASPKIWEIALCRETVLPRLMQRYASEANETGFAACARLLAVTNRSEERQTMLSALGQGLQGRQLKKVPEDLRKQLGRFWKHDTTDEALIRVLAAFGDRTALQRAVNLVRDSRVPEDIRLSMLRIIGESGYDRCASELLNLVDDREPEPLQVAVIEAMLRFTGDQIGKEVLARYARMTESLQAKARSLLFSRSVWALPFLREMKQGKYQAKEVPIEEVRRLALLQDEEVNALVRGLWGNVHAGTPEEKLAEVRRFNNDLRAARGNPDEGRVLFDKHCGKCHRLFGKGREIGPDLTYVDRKDTQFLLTNIVDPSSTVRKEYTSYIVRTHNGRILTGLLVEQTPTTLTIQDENERTTVARDDVVLLKESSLSPMPEKILNDLSPHQRRDLFSYLQSDAAR
ncbi:MAG: c-type cytochrome [Acidimicrobiia bacterium]|nr:c-type cytochrome [Acidimicrobiia bacterium]